MKGKHPLKPPALDVVALTGNGRVAMIDLPGQLFADIYKQRRAWRGAVTRDTVLGCYLVFDLAHADAVTARRWWMVPAGERARAIAKALWFARDIEGLKQEAA